MNPFIIEGLFAIGTKVLDSVLTKKKEGLKNEKPKFEKGKTTAAQYAKAQAAHAISERQLSPGKGAASTLVTAVGFALLLAVQSGYISPASMQCMIDAAAEVEAKVIEQKAD